MSVSGLDINGFHERSPLEAHVQAKLEFVPAHAWYALPNGALTFVHPDDCGETRRVWSDCLRPGSGVEAGFRVHSADGSYRWLLSHAGRVRVANGTLPQWIGINFDIEERKQAEFCRAEGERFAYAAGWAIAWAFRRRTGLSSLGSSEQGSK